MKAGLDTSMVLRLLVGEPFGQAQAALQYLLKLQLLLPVPLLCHDVPR